MRVKLPAGTTWDAARGHEPRRDPRARPVPRRASCRCRTRTIPKAACCSPSSQIDEIKKQEARDLTRFDLDFDLPDHFLPEFPPPIFLTTRPDLGDVSKGKLVTIDNFYELFNGILNPKQLEGLRLLVTPFPQQQFNQTDDRRIGEGRAAASPASTATPTATPTPPPTWSATSGRRSSATASTRRRCAASTSSGCSARSAR